MSPYGFPAREIIAVYAQRSYKNLNLERLIKELQLEYRHQETEKLYVLDWK